VRKTLFAGLTVLSSDESVTEDGGAFIGRDRDSIDRYLELGAKTHRHDGSVGLADPVTIMDGTALASGGAIGADRSFSISYTLEDGSGGETLIAPSILVSTPQPLDPPFVAPTGEAEYEMGGDLPVDTYYYAFSFSDDGGGETPIGPALPVERAPGYTEAHVTLAGMGAAVASASAGSWRLYRAVGGGEFGYLASGTADSYVDDGSAQANCDITPLTEEVNTTNGDNSLEIRLPSADVRVAESTFINVYLSEAGDFVGDVLLQQFPLASAGQSVLYRDITTVEGQPPDVNSSIGGASQIDPDTELLDWHWKRPVANEAALPVDAEEGDVRVLLDSGNPWVYVSGAWEAWSIGGSGGVGGGASGITIGAAGVGLDPLELDPWTNGWVDLYPGSPALEWDSGTERMEELAGSYSSVLRTGVNVLTGFKFEARFPSPIGSESVSAWIKRLADGSTIQASIDDDDLTLSVFVNGIGQTTSLSEAHSLTDGTEYWLRATQTGNDIWVGVYDADPDVGSPTPLHEITHTLLAGDERTTLGVGIEGYYGLFYTNGGTAAWVDDLVYNGELLVGKLNFDGEGVTVEETGDGEATVTIAPPHIHHVLASGGAKVTNPEGMVFAASGGAAVAVTEVGGSARVLIGAAPGGGGGGMGASALLDVEDADGPTYSDISKLQFTASGSASVGVSDLGGGSARVTIYAETTPGEQGIQGEQGEPGPPGAGGARHQAAGSAGVGISYDDGYTEYRASGALALGVNDLGGGASAAVTIAPLGRAWASASINLASGASGTVEFAGSAAGARLLKLSTSKRARVRMYPDQTSQAADIARAIGTQHDDLTDGVMLDFMLAAASGGVRRLSPTIDVHNLEEPVANVEYLTVTNYDADGDVVVAFLYIPTEVV
jgi:hypothetical protein